MQARMAEGFFLHIVSKTISRVMSLNGHLSRPAALCSLFGLASNGVYMDPSCYQESGGLLHHLSTLTPACRCGIFLLHCPWSRLRQTLSGTLPCEARTFLSRSLSALRQRPSVLLGIYYTILLPVCQLTNFPVTH